MNDGTDYKYGNYRNFDEILKMVMSKPFAKRGNPTGKHSILIDSHDIKLIELYQSNNTSTLILFYKPLGKTGEQWLYWIPTTNQFKYFSVIYQLFKSIDERNKMDCNGII